MVYAPFTLTPLVLDVLAVLVKNKQPLSSMEVTERLPKRRYTHITKALGRMHASGWLTRESTPRPGNTTVMGYALNAPQLPLAIAILKEQKRPKRKSPTNTAPLAPEPLGRMSWRHNRVLIAEVILNGDAPVSISQIAMRTQLTPDNILKSLLRMEVEGFVEADRPYDPARTLPERTFTITADRREIVTERVERWRRENPYWKTWVARNRQMSFDLHTDYLSTACRHEKHQHCRSTTAADGAAKEPGTCKFCDAKCICYCHPWNNTTDNQ